MFDYSYNYNDPGSVPGTLEIEDDAVPSQIVLIDYNEKRAVRLKNLTPEDCSTYLTRDSISWFDVGGLGSKDVLQKLGQIFELHPLVLEDIVNVPQRPKVENYDNQLLIITQMVLPHQEKQSFWIEQVSFIVGKNYLLTVQEEPEQDCFTAVRERLKHNKGNIRQRGTDYLAYCLWDAIIDGYFPVLEDYGERLEDLEDEVILHPTKETLQKIYSIKRELLTLRRAIWPQRNAIQVLLRDETSLIGKEINIHYDDDWFYDDLFFLATRMV